MWAPEDPWAIMTFGSANVDWNEVYLSWLSELPKVVCLRLNSNLSIFLAVTDVSFADWDGSGLWLIQS